MGELAEAIGGLTLAHETGKLGSVLCLGPPWQKCLEEGPHNDARTDSAARQISAADGAAPSPSIAGLIRHAQQGGGARKPR